MNENTIDLKQLFYLIREQKGLQANLNLDEGCTLEADDPKPLIKVLNYLLNYLKQLSEHPLEISLDLLPESYRLSMLAYSVETSLPEVSNQVQATLKDYQAKSTLEHNSEKYVRITVTFNK